MSQHLVTCARVTLVVMYFPISLFALPPLEIEPIQGLTTVRHRAPAEFTVPLGTHLRICQRMPEQLPSRSTNDVEAFQVVWENAEPTHRAADAAFAECAMTETGAHQIRVRIIGEGGRSWENSCLVNVSNVRLDRVSLRSVTPVVAPVHLDEDLTNEQTMGYFFGSSIASLTHVRPEIMSSPRHEKWRQVVHRYRTSVDRPIAFELETNPPGLESLMEVRFFPDYDQEPFLAATGSHIFKLIGERGVMIGPIGRERILDFDVYQVNITSHISNHDIVLDKQSITFTAVTDPPGYEDEITWLSSTKYGTAKPVFGRGPTFTTQFDRTWGDDPEIGRFQWLGVKADHVVFNQDQKGFPQAGTDTIEHELRVELDVGDNGTVDETLVFSGQMEVERCDPFVNPQGRRQINFTVTSWHAIAFSKILDDNINYVLADVPQNASTIISELEGADFPARFKFNVIFDVVVGGVVQFPQHHGMPEEGGFLVVPPNGNRSKSPTITHFEAMTILFEHPILGPMRFTPLGCNDQNSSTTPGPPPQCVP